MTTAVSAELVREFFAARVACDSARIGALVDDDIEWSISGPVDILPYAGQRRGKQAVLDTVIQQGRKVFEVTDVTIEDIVVDGDKAIVRTRLSGVHHPSGRRISYHGAQLLAYRNGKIVRFHAIIDSFDAAEQMLGREIDISDAPPNAGPAVKVPAL
jgi:ketosteroid isomerase-like protein